MEEIENSQDSISTDMMILNEKKYYFENDSKKFFGFIKNYKTEEIRNFLSNNNKYIWKYISKEDNDETVIHLSIKTNEIPIISLILQYCRANLNEEEFKSLINKTNLKGVVALHYASFQGNVDIIKYLINYGADVKASTLRDLNVIHYAAQGNKPNSLVYFYLFHKNEIELEKIDKGGSTPLHWASYSSSTEIAMYLLNYGANINKKDKNGNTPLHLAVIKNSYKMVQKLLQKGADNSIKNNDDKTAKDIAYKNNSTDIYELLKDSEQCQFCNIKAPVHKEARSKKNIIIAFFFQIFSFFILFCFIFPIYIINDNFKILYGFFFFGYIILTIIFMILYIKLIFMDPGRPQKRLTNEKIKQLMKVKDVKINLFKYCPTCLVRRNKNLKHCIICDQCCEGFDHHCYWVNNCVGKNNYNYFIVFLFLSFFDVFYICFISIFSFFVNADASQKYENKKLFSFKNFQNLPIFFLVCKFKSIKIILNIILLLSSLFFLIPQFFLILIHSKNLCEKNKKKIGRRTATFVSTSNEDLLLNEIIGPDQEYCITDFNSY